MRVRTTERPDTDTEIDLTNMASIAERRADGGCRLAFRDGNEISIVAPRWDQVTQVLNGIAEGVTMEITDANTLFGDIPGQFDDRPDGFAPDD